MAVTSPRAPGAAAPSAAPFARAAWCGDFEGEATSEGSMKADHSATY
jgi:hypothetical protein